MGGKITVVSHGACEGGQCNCTSPYITRDCSVDATNDDTLRATACSSNGVATVWHEPKGLSNEHTVSCACDATYGGPDCSRRCGLDENALPCGGHGWCDDSFNRSTGPGVCHCESGWGGEACDVLCCNGHGVPPAQTCSSSGDGLSGCACELGFGGRGCVDDLRPYKPTISVTTSIAGDVATLAVRWSETEQTDAYRVEYAEVVANASLSCLLL